MNIDGFSQQLSGMAARLSLLLDHANTSSCPTPDLPVDTFKELGIATEELQVAVEELQQQNEELADALELVAAERKRYQDLFQSAPQAYLVTNLEGVIQETNRMAAQLLGVPMQFLIGKPLLLFIHEADRPSYWAELQQRRQRDFLQDWEFRLQPRNQDLVDVACSTVVIRDEDYRPIGFRWILKDVTDRKRLEALERNQHNLENNSDAALFQDRPIRYYSQGELIPLHPQSLWYIKQGLVKLTSLTEQSKEILVGLVGTGMPFGAYLTALSIYQAIALSDVQLVSVSLTELTSSPHLAQLLLARTGQRLRQTETLVTILGEQRTENRLYRMLQLLKAEVGEPVPQGTRLNVRLTHEDLASACCSTRVTITRLLSKLQRQGKITFDDARRIILME